MMKTAPRTVPSPASCASDDRGNSSKKFHVNPCVLENEKSQVAQVEKIAEIVKRNAKQQAKRSRVKKSKAKTGLAEEKVPPQKHPDDVIVAELKSETSPNFRRPWAEEATKVCRRYLREVLQWEGSKPLTDVMACRRCQSPVQPRFCCGGIKSIGMAVNEKTELQGLAELGIKDFETLEEVRSRQADMLDCLASSFVAPHVYAGLSDCRGDHCGPAPAAAGLSKFRPFMICCKTADSR
jgi:hypothetical protein